MLSQTFEVFLQQKIVFTAVGCLENTLMEHVQFLLKDNCIMYKLLLGNINDIQDTFALQNIKTSMKLLLSRERFINACFQC